MSEEQKFTPDEQKILESVSVSYWLKTSIRLIHHREILDYLNDCECLCQILQKRWTEENKGN
jgi:hypothetical protein